MAKKRPITADNIGNFGRLSVSADIDLCLIGRSLERFLFDQKASDF